MGLSPILMSFLGLSSLELYFLSTFSQLVNMFSALFNPIDSKELMLLVCGSP